MENFNIEELTKEQIQEVFDKKITLLGIMGDAISLPDDWRASKQEIEQYAEERENEVDDSQLYIAINQF